MKKLIGVIAVLFTLLLCVIHRHLTSHPARSRPETAYVPKALQHGFFISALLLQ